MITEAFDKWLSTTLSWDFHDIRTYTLMMRLYSVTRHLTGSTGISQIMTYCHQHRFRKMKLKCEYRGDIKNISRFLWPFLSGVFLRSDEVFTGCTFYLTDGSITTGWYEQGNIFKYLYALSVRKSCITMRQITNTRLEIRYNISLCYI